MTATPTPLEEGRFAASSRKPVTRSKIFYQELRASDDFFAGPEEQEMAHG